MSESSLSGRRGPRSVRGAQLLENAGRPDVASATSANASSTPRSRSSRRSGFYATRVSEVAKAAGVADGTIYLYFKSKDELLVSLFEDRVEQLLAYMREELPKLDSAPAGFGASSSCSSACSKESAIWPRSSPSSCGSRRSS